MTMPNARAGCFIVLVPEGHPPGSKFIAKFKGDQFKVEVPAGSGPGKPVWVQAQLERTETREGLQELLGDLYRALGPVPAADPERPCKRMRRSRRLINQQASQAVKPAPDKEQRA